MKRVAIEYSESIVRIPGIMDNLGEDFITNGTKGKARGSPTPNYCYVLRSVQGRGGDYMVVVPLILSIFLCLFRYISGTESVERGRS